MWNKYLNNTTQFIKKSRSGVRKTAVFAIGLLVILIPVVLIINKNSQKVEAAWSPAHNQWAKRQRLSITNNSGENLASGTTVGVSIDTKSLSISGKLQSNCNDIRVVYQPNDTTFKELPHHLVLPNNSLCYTSSATLINFSLQSALNSASTSTEYYLYFGNSEATASTLISADAYDVSTINATLVCPFRGTTNCVNASGSATASSQSGAIRYPGLKSGLTFDGVNDYISTADSTSLSVTGDLTVELWVKPKRVGVEQTLLGKWDETTANDDRSYRIFITSDDKFAFSVSSAGTAASVVTITGGSTISKDTWYHVAGVYSTSAQTLNLYINGTSDATQVGSAGSSIDNNASLFYFGGKENSSGAVDTFFLGLLDEARISNVIRYTSNFTVPLNPHRLDFFTNALYHMDETGSDPRDAGKILDETTNNNDATISGATFVSGFIGIDGPSEFGEHNGTSNAAVLNDDTASWSENEWVGYILFNSTDASHGVVTSNTVSSVTASMSGGTENDWDSGDLYTLSPDLGQTHSQSFASHGGVFVEEASTNKIENPSFENTTYDTSWTEGTGSGVITAVTRTTADTGGGTQDITNSNLGGYTPEAVYIIANYATTDGSARTHSSGSIGAATGTSNEWVIAFKAEDGVGTDDSDSYSTDTGLIQIQDPTTSNMTPGALPTIAFAEFSTFITNGVRVNWTIGPDEAVFLTVIFFAGSELSAHANTVNLGDTTDNAIDVTAPGFQPDLVLTALSFTAASPALEVSQGAVYYNGSTYSQNGMCRRSGGTMPYPSALYITTSGAICEILGNYTAYDWYGEFGTFDANGFTVTTRTRGANNTNLRYLALDLGTSVPAWVGTHTTPTSTGNSSETDPGFAPQLAFQIETFAEAADTNYSDANGGTFGTSVFDANGQFSNSWATEDAASTTNTQSISDDIAVNITDHVGGTGVEGSATLNASGWTTNYTAVESAGKIFPSFAIGSLNYLTQTIETSSPYVKFGSRSAKIVASGSDTSLVNEVNPGNTNSHTMSLYAYNGTSGTVGGAIDNTVARIYWEGASQSSTTYENVGGGWWRLSYTATTTNAANDYGVWIADGETLYVDGFALEEKAYSTTFTDGSLGTGYTWAGTINESASSRSLTNLEYASSSHISASAGSMSMWVKPNWPGNDGVEHNFFDADTSSGSLRLYKSTANDLSFTDGTNTATLSISGWAKNEWHHIVATWSAGTLLDLYVDSSAGTGSGAFSAPTLSGGGNIHIGKKADDTLAANTELSDVRIFDGALSASEITDIYQAGLISVQIGNEVDRFSSSKGQDPIALYHFDDFYGTIAHDSTPNLNHLTISGPVWGGDPAGDTGLRASYLKFDGTNDYLSRATDNDFNFDSEGFTVGGWFKHPAAISGIDMITVRYDTAGFKVYMDSSGYICFAIDDDGSYGPDDEVCTTSTLGSLVDSNWHHFSAVKDGTSSIKIYVDGVEINSLDTLTASGTLNSNSVLYIGSDSGGSSNYWDGFLDEIAFYPYAKTSDQIKNDFVNSQSAFLFGTINTDAPTEGLVGYWKMDEESWSNDCAADAVMDTSGVGEHGRACPDTTGPTGGGAGKFGYGGTFDGSNDYIDLNDFNYLDGKSAAAVSAWIKPNFINTESTSRQIWGSSNFSMYFNANRDNFTLVVNTANGSVDVNTVGLQWTQNTWHHIAGVYDGNNAYIYWDGERAGTASASGSLNASGSDESIGKYISANFWLGNLDEIRAYTKALTADEVKDLYKWAPGPVTYLPFDEGTGTTSVYDRSGNGNTGTMNGDMTAQNWVQGKYGTALDFDGINDFVNIPASEDFTYGAGHTFSLWIKPDVVNIQQSPISQNYDGSKITDFWINSTTLRWETDGGENFNANTALQAGEWQYIVGVYSAETGIASIYIDGVFDESSSLTSDVDFTDTPIFIGKYNSSQYYFNGSIDDVKIYNYPRTPEQIVADMNIGHPAPGSPIGSATAHWTFDEGFGTVVYDQSINKNNLVQSTGNSSSTDSGKFGKAWDGTGSNWLYKTDAPELDFGANEDFTLSMWFKSDGSGNPAGIVVLMDKHTETDNPGYRLSFGPMSGQVMCEIDDDTTAFPDDSATSTIDYYDGIWHHAVCVRDISENDLYLYMDGELVASNGSLSATGDLSNSADLIIGDGNGADDGDEFAGDIDEIKIFRSALDSEQVKVLYNQSSGLNLGALSTDSSGSPSWSASRQYCVPGDTSTCNSPISEWLFDQGTGTGSTAVKDTSVNSLDGTMDSSMTENNWIKGAKGTAMNFSGNPQRVTLDDYNLLAGAGTFSLEIWVKPDFLSNDASNRHVFDFGPFALRFNAARDDFTCSMINTVPTSFDADTTSVNWDRNSWHQIYCVYDGSTWKAYWDGKLESSTGASGVFQGASAADKYIGYSATSGLYFNGGIDTFRIYDYARSPKQINWDYNRGKPIYDYGFDECSGTTAYNAGLDSNGTAKGVNLTITPQSLGNTSAGSCSSGTSTEMWNNGTSGKFNYSLDFDGSDDYAVSSNTVLITENNSDTYNSLSWGGWFYPSTASASDTLIHKNNEFKLTTDASGYPQCEIYSGSWQTAAVGTATLSTSSWNHVICTYDGTDIKLYVNGNLADTQAETDSLTSSSSTALNIARDSAGSGYFDGKIDNVRIWQFDLSSVQVKLDYNDGAVNYGN